MTTLLYYNNQNSESKCNWLMNSLAQGWPNCSPADRSLYTQQPGHFWGFIENNWIIIKQHKENNIDWWFWDMPYWGRWNGLKEALAPDQKFYWRVSKNCIHETKIKSRN